MKQTNSSNKVLSNNQGQTLVEFVLLISSIMLISLLYLKGVNGNIAKYWKIMAEILIEDPNQTLEFK